MSGKLLSHLVLCPLVCWLWDAAALRRIAVVLQLWGPMGHPRNQLKDVSLIPDPSGRVACVR